MKKWFQSKTIWSALIVALIGIYEIVDAQLGPAFGFNLPEIPSYVLTILGALGIYGRTGAIKKIG